MIKDKGILVSESTLKDFLAQKKYSQALLMTEALLTKTPTDERYLLMLGRLYELIEEQMDAEPIYLELIKKIPCAYNTHLMLGRYYHNNSNIEKAFKHYVYALRTANNAGFWLNQESTAPWAYKLVVQALNFTDKYRRDVVGSWIDELNEKYGENEIERVTKGMRMYSKEIPTTYSDDRQKPGFLYIPDLPAKPIFDRGDLDFVDYYESQFEKIKSELDEILAKKVTIENYSDSERHGLTTGGEWDARFFFRHGKRYDDTHELCPDTSTTLSKLPLVHIQDHSPEVCISVLRPGAHLLPHRGVTNSRSVLHMGLTIPSQCALNIVDIAELHWQPGRAFAFDDTYMHEAWNRSDESRYVLLADIWNPFLRESEREAITSFVEKAGILNRQYPAQEILKLDTVGSH